MNLINQTFFTILLLFTFAFTACSAAEGEIDFPKIPVSQSVPKFRVETVATNLEVVWSIVFAPDGRMFFTERPGRVRVMENGKLRENRFLLFPMLNFPAKAV